MEATIVKLGGGQGADLQVVGFDEAFGEYSEARGRGRARRKKRKLERIRNRQEVRAARAEARKARIQARKEAQQARIGKRTSAQQLRQEKRRAAMEARQQKRTARKQYRIERRALGQDVEGEMDDQTAVENGVDEQAYAPEQSGGGYSEQGYAPEQGGGEQGYSEQGYAPEGRPNRPQGGGGYQDSGEDWNTPPQGFEQSGGYEEEQGGGSYGGGYDEGGYDENGYGEGGSEESSYDEGSYDEGSYDEGGYSEDEYGFDGVMGDEDSFSEFQDGLTVSPEVKSLADKLEWNKELYSRLSKRKGMRQANGANTERLDKMLFAVRNRIAELDAKLQRYQNFEGEYSNAEGRPANAEWAKRQRMVRKARNFAKRQRMRLNKQMRVNGGDVTKVERDLNPEFSSQRIVIPPTSNYTGISAIDNQNDYDGDNLRIVELKSNASGDGKKINWVAIGIGAVVAVGAIWAIRKYKVLGK